MVPKFHSPPKKKTTFPWFPGWYVLFSPRFYALGQVSDDCLFLVKFTWDHWLPLVGCFLVLDPSQKKHQKPAKHAKEWTLNMYKKGKIPGYSNYTAWYRIYIYTYIWLLITTTIKDGEWKLGLVYRTYQSDSWFPKSFGKSSKEESSNTTGNTSRGPKKSVSCFPFLGIGFSISIDCSSL